VNFSKHSSRVLAYTGLFAGYSLRFFLAFSNTWRMPFAAFISSPVSIPLPLISFPVTTSIPDLTGLT